MSPSHARPDARLGLALPLSAEQGRWATGPWTRLSRPASSVRRKVFVEEMKVPLELDIDGTDAGAIHLVFFSGRRAIATGRLRTAQMRIGRVAVLEPFRGRGIGRELVIRLMREAVRARLAHVELHAQADAVGFYARLGFRPQGRLFNDAGIPHRRMRRDLQWKDATAAVIVRSGKFFLGCRAPGKIMADHWDLFGGKLEPGETPAAALVRELEEELAIDARIGGRLGISLYDDPRDGCIFRCPVYRVARWKGEIRLNPEHSRAEWLTLARLRRRALAHPDIPGLCALALGRRP